MTANVRFGSLAATDRDITRTAASGGKAAAPHPDLCASIYNRNLRSVVTRIRNQFLVVRPANFGPVRGAWTGSSRGKHQIPTIVRMLRPLSFYTQHSANMPAAVQGACKAQRQICVLFCLDLDCRNDGILGPS